MTVVTGLRTCICLSGMRERLSPLRSSVLPVAGFPASLPQRPRMAWRVMMPKKISTMFSHEQLVG
ncbi:hypothetical protein EV644_12426 [Kribbella orskensis]|uniref:Uncharacterized protein n=1 Tax=Kribbella orskensis TaxID=2512216 RepID=A0ABY2B9N6_9ACTN|nr:hypothetical protein [Kribbella sp. VKM Ac-2500]TCN32780.1 hypothetical protein EV642_12672 [Kribbella sp. VKM Ac-2500]TCO12902.1 hypothetical protein EV644_12426 [Kribbella orskensis]